MEYKWKWISIGTVGSLFALSHIGMIGMLSQRGNNFPKVNLPTGEYTSYTVEASDKGYRINYRANDPLVMGVRKDIVKPSGFLGMGKSVLTVEEQYTMDGARHHGGSVSTKSAWLDSTGSNPESGVSDKTIACIKAEGAGSSTGGVIGASVGAQAAPALSQIPIIGWVAGGWATMFGQKTGANLGGDIAKAVEGC